MPLWICIEGGFLGVSVVKNLPVNAGDPGDASWILESARSPGEGNGNPLECSCLQNPIDRRAWWATVHGVTKSQTHTHTHTHTHTQKHFLLNVLFPYIVMSFKIGKAVVKVLCLPFIFSQMPRVVQCVGKREA